MSSNKALSDAIAYDALVNSKFFLAMIDPRYLTDPQCLQRVSWARQLKKPCLLVIDPDVSQADVDRVFNGMNIIDRMTLDRSDPGKTAEWAVSHD